MLKIKNVFYMFFFSVLLVGCTEEIEFRQTNITPGLLYKDNEKNPFSGRILDYPARRLNISALDLCKADIKNGMPDGTVECIRDNVVIYTGKYTAGKRDGAEHYFSETGAKVSSKNWKGGVKNGVEKVWAEDGKTEMASLVWKDGKATGFLVKGGDRINYLDGQITPHGK